MSHFPPGPPPSMAVDYKKGEVNEVRMVLRDRNTERDPNKRKEALKKVVALMTLGVDVSELFADIIMLSRTKDIVQKKLIYLYITHYAHTGENQNTALLAVNTLQTDCRDDDPMIRGLALRTLCSLRVKNLIEYCLKSIDPALNDANAYVRRTAVVGVLKMYHISPATIKVPAYLNRLYDLLRDRDAQVVVNCFNVLNEIQADEGGMTINKAIVHHVLNRLRDFNEWQQCVVLDSIARYTPDAKEEIFDIMNLLEDTFRNSNSALVLAATKVFLNLTQSLPTIHEQVLQRLKSPLITLMVSGSNESCYSCLCHLKLLVQRSPTLFAQDYKHFFCRGNDWTCVKKVKVDILVAVVSPLNMSDILAELSEYVTDVDVALARHSIQAIGRVGFHLPQALEKSVGCLRGFLPLGIEYVTAETITTIRDLVRKHASVREAVQDCVDAFSNVEDASAKISILYMLGEYGEDVENAPYIIEGLVDSYHDEPPEVKTELLNAAMKLFFKRPPEMRPPLGQLLSKAAQDVSNTDVHDRALFYVRMLKYDIDEAKRVCSPPLLKVERFQEENTLELQDRLFEEFNTLAVLYGKPSEAWVRRPPLGDNNQGDHDDDDEEAEEEEEEEEEEEDEEGGRENGGGQQGGLPALELDAHANMEGADFESAWGAMEAGEVFSGQMTRGFSAPEEFTTSIAELGVSTVAFGNVDNEMKFYVYAKPAFADAFVLSEVVVNAQTMTYTVTVKCHHQAALSAFTRWFRALLSHL